MNSIELIAELDRLGIRIEADGDKLRYSPRSAMTPDLVEGMKTHKAELLVIMQPEAHNDVAGWDDAIEPPDPCPKCGTLELWQSVAGDPFGQTPGTWRCVRCDPPTTARRLRELAVRLRKQAPRMARGGPKARGSTWNACGASMRQTGS